MKAKIFLFALIASTLLLFPSKAHADIKTAGPSASFNDLLVMRESDDRAMVLRSYLEEKGSPLAPYADLFVSQADLYKIDWRFVVAISGVESTFGKAVPCTNAWGWGIYGSHMYCFPSYEEAIRTISKELRERYIDGWNAQTVYAIGSYYAASPTWASRVVYFMNDIQNFKDAYENTPLPISL